MHQIRFVLGPAQTLVTLAKILYIPSQQPLFGVDKSVHPLPITKFFTVWRLLASFQNHQEMGTWLEDFRSPQMTVFGACLHLTSYCSNFPGLACSQSTHSVSSTVASYQVI